jgi:hypothetical protein
MSMSENIQELIQTSIHRPLNSVEEKAIIDYLKSISDQDAYEVIKSLIDQQSQISIVIPKKVLNQKQQVKSLLQHVLADTDAQSIKIWLEFAIPKLGFKAVVKLIKELSNDENRLIEKAVYWLPLFIPNNEKRALDLLEDLKQTINYRSST